MSVKLNSSGGGSITLQEPSTASNRTLTLPDNTGNLISSADVNTVTPTMLSQPLTRMNAQTASGSSVDFTGIPSWAKRIVIILDGVSFAAAGAARFRLGTSSGIVSTGYSSQTYAILAGGATTSSTANDGIGFFTTGAAAGTNSGRIVIENITGNTWVSNQVISRPADSYLLFAVASITLSDTLDRVSVVAITSTFDAGTINVMYEG